MKLEHVAIWVRDIERTRSFFERYFGTISGARYDNARGFSSYFLTFPDCDTRIEIMQLPDVEAVITPCSGHIAIALGSKEQVDKMTEQLVNDGQQLVSGPRITGDGYYESCLQINNEFVIELTV